MSNKLLLLLLLCCLQLGCTAKETNEYWCFFLDQYQNEKLCYDQAKFTEKNKIALEKAKDFLINLDNLEARVVVQGDMASRYTLEKLQSSLKRGYASKSPDNIAGVISAGNHTTVYFDKGEQIIFGHVENAFIFDFVSPTRLAGAGAYLGQGYLPSHEQIDRGESNCHLDKENIMFLSPSADHDIHQTGGSYCSYKGYGFRQGDPSYAWPVPVSGEFPVTNSDSEYTDFLDWLKADTKQAIE
jgi:hypothetical protein